MGDKYKQGKYFDFFFKEEILGEGILCWSEEGKENQLFL